MSELFEKSMPELREAFVRSRFAEHQNFSREDVEDWLKQQREADVPDAHHWWWAYGGRSWATARVSATALTGLRACATQVVDPKEITDKGYFARLCQLMLNQSGLYWGHDNQGVYFLRGSFPENELFVVTLAPGGLFTMYRLAGNDRTCGSVIVNIYLAEWLKHRPRWREARAFLCNLVAEAVAQERAKAQADFDYAVAVSADGKKIVCADWVFVEEKGGSRRLPGEAFREHKAKLGRRAAMAQGNLPTLENTERSVWKFFIGMDLTINFRKERGVDYQVCTCGSFPNQFNLLLIRREFCEDVLFESNSESAV